MAVARQRKEAKEIDQVAQSRADKVTSHWWKGIVSLEGIVASDEYRKPSPSTQASYQQQLEAQICQSRERGLFLALPSLRDRLNLSLFEKNLIILGLAPEISRRYAQLYRYLQGDNLPTQTDLPTIDLALRLLCRTDTEWRAARLQLMADSPLLRHQLLRLSASDTDSFLNQPIKLSDSLLSYLLSDQPTAAALDRLLVEHSPSPSPLLLLHSPNAEWNDLVLPDGLMRSLHSLCHPAPATDAATAGTVTLWVGATGTGKTTAAHAIAHSQHSSLAEVDLTRVAPADYGRLCQEMIAQAPTLLLLRSADLWLKRSAAIAPTLLQQLFDHRHTQAGLTILTVSLRQSVSLRWRSHLDSTLVFPNLDRNTRLLLWQRAFSTVPTADVNWEGLAQLKLNGKEIIAIAQTATQFDRNSDIQVGMEQISQALAHHEKFLPFGYR